MPEVGSDGFLVNSALQEVATADGYVVDDRAANGDGINPNLKDSSSRKLPQQPSIEYDEPLNDSNTLPQTSATASASASRQLSTISIAGQAGAGHVSDALLGEELRCTVAVIHFYECSVV